MATLQKRKGRPFWYARFQVDGHQYELSTGKTKKSDASDEMDRLIEEKREETAIESLFDVMDDRLSDLSNDEGDKLRRELAARLLQGLGSKLKLVEAWDAWSKNPKKRNPGLRTIAGYRGRWTSFTKWLNKVHPKVAYLHEVTPAIADAYASHLWGQGISPSTYNLHTGFLRGMFNVLKTQAGLQVNVWEDLPRMALETNSRRELTSDELTLVFKKAEGDLRYMFALGLYTGMRLGDVVTLRWSAVDLKAGYITHTPMKTRRQSRVIRLPIHPVLESLLHQLEKESKKPSEFLFPDEAKRYAEDGSAISKEIQKHYELCEIQTLREGTGRKSHEAAMKEVKAARDRREKVKDPEYTRAVVEVGFHSLRHSFVSLCAANKVPQVAIMELVGHGSPAMTRLYSHAGDEQKAKAIAALPDITRPGEPDG